MRYLDSEGKSLQKVDKLLEICIFFMRTLMRILRLGFFVKDEGKIGKKTKEDLEGEIVYREYGERWANNLGAEE